MTNPLNYNKNLDTLLNKIKPNKIQVLNFLNQI